MLSGARLFARPLQLKLEHTPALRALTWAVDDEKAFAPADAANRIAFSTILQGLHFLLQQRANVGT